MKKNILFIVLISALIIPQIALGAWWNPFSWNIWNEILNIFNKPEEQIACTMDAKICPDGSAVGRIAPNCEFAECPEDETMGWKIHKSEDYGFEIKYPVDWTDMTPTLSSVGRFIFSAPAEQPKDYSLLISVQENKEKLSSKNFVQNLLAENAKQEIGKIKYKSIKEIILAGLPAQELTEVFAYDRNEERIYLAKEDKVFVFSFPSAQDNPNFEKPIENNAIARKIISTFTFKKIENEPVTKEQACIKSGGKIMDVDCYCSGTQDFFNNCAVGACTCTPDKKNLKKLKSCECPKGECFDGISCVNQEL